MKEMKITYYLIDDSLLAKREQNEATHDYLLQEDLGATITGSYGFID